MLAMDILGQVFVTAIKLVFSDLRIQVGPAGIRLSIESRQKPIDERLEKIEAAGRNLSEALQAIDSLREEANSNKKELEEIESQLSSAKQAYSEINSEIDTVQKLASLDAATTRKALGIPSKIERWAERLIGFVSGVAASITASFIWHILGL